MPITTMKVLVFISDGCARAVGLVRSGAVRHRAIGPDRTVGSAVIAAMLFANVRKSSALAFVRLASALGWHRLLQALLPASVCLWLYATPRRRADGGSHFLVTVRGTRRGIPAATLAMPIQMRGAIDFTGFRSGHAVFRCMGEGWPQQHHNSNDDNTHVRNTHDREPYLFTGQSERRSRLGTCALRPAIYPAWVGHNETRLLSLMSGIWVNSGTAPRRAVASGLIRHRSLTVAEY